MRRLGAVLVVVTMVVTGLVATPAAGAAGGAEIKPEPPTLDETVELALADIDEFWTKNIKRAYPGLRYDPINTLLPYDETNWQEVGTCGTYVESSYQENAFYCSAEEKIVWDIGTWFPRIYSEVSYLTIPAILAHEWGHAIQDQGGLNNISPPSILVEQSADCFAGVYLRFLADGKSKRFPVIDSADLDAMVAITLQISDQPGTPTSTPGAHGSPYDRVNAIQEGFEEGPRRCARYDRDAPATLDLEFTDPEDAATGGNLDLETITSLVQSDLDDFWSKTLTKYQPVALVEPYDVDTAERLPQCGKTEPREAFRNTIFYCADGDFVAWDNIILEEAHEAYGDFAVATLLANQWSYHVQDVLGVPFVPATLPHKVCLTGAYIGNVYRQSRPSAQLQLSAGDLDEAIQVQLNYEQFKGKESVFTKMSALRRGFFDGADSCAQLLPKKLRP